MNQQIPSSVTLIASRPLLEDVHQAMLHVESLLHLNDQYQSDIEAGQLNGMSLILKNAEKVLATTRAALAATAW